MVYVAGRKANAAKLPSQGLRLNASKPESHPDMSNDNHGANRPNRLEYFRVVRIRRLEWCNAMLMTTSHASKMVWWVVNNQIVLSVIAQNRL